MVTTICIAWLCVAVGAQAQWRWGGVPVCQAPKNQSFPTILADGEGGVFISWRDQRDSVANEYDVYIQRLSANGTPLWDSCGIALYAGPGSQYEAELALDGQGGVIAAWGDLRNGFNFDIYAQRVDGFGHMLWASGGVSLSNSAGHKYLSRCIVSDGAGGAIVSWDETTTGTNSNVWAQRIDLNGNLMWHPRGRPICTADGFQVDATMVSDEHGGAYIAWDDWRATPMVQVYAQRIDGAGVPYWPLNGILISSTTIRGQRAVMVPNGSGGAIMGWHDGGIHAQRLGDDGPRWQEGGILVCAPPSLVTRIAADEAGGAFLAWTDRRSDVYNTDVYAQKVDSTGATQWQLNGIPISTSNGSQEAAAVVADGVGGAIVAWVDYQSRDERNLLVQHLDATGMPQLSANGDALGGSADNDPVLASDGSGGAIITWGDNRNGTFDDFSQPLNLDIYAARVTFSGLVDVPQRTTPDFKLLPARPNPTRAETAIPFELPTAMTVDLEVFSPAGQRVRALARSRDFAPGKHELTWNGRSDDGQLAPPGVYLVRMAVSRRSVVGRIVLLR